MEYISTRNSSETVSPCTAIVRGLAADGGLYVPASIPELTQDELFSLCDRDYPQRAAYIMQKFLTDLSYDELLNAATAAYSRFDGDPAPLVKVDDGIYMLELWHGPTLAFKDVALTLLPHLLALAKQKLGIERTTHILVATSGDTGKAALEGFKDVPGTKVTVYYPSEGVSQMQKLQMVTQQGKNLEVYGVKGNFDDCQTAVKSIFADQELRQTLLNRSVALSSANSINWGRLLPQIVYYVSAYVDLLGENQIKMGSPVNFCVPTGNFGNILAGWYAWRMGVPMGKLICASNSNNVLTDFFARGEYNTNRDFYKTMSPSMDILVSSNLERLLFETGGRNGAVISKYMKQLADTGSYRITADEHKTLVEEFYAGYATEDQTIEAIEDFFEEYNYPLDPHTAVAVHVGGVYRSRTDDFAPQVVLSTANPYKFPQDVLFALTGDDVRDSFRACKKLLAETAMEVPPGIQALKILPKLHSKVILPSEIKETVL